MDNFEEIDLTQFLPEEALAEYGKEKTIQPPVSVPASTPVSIPVAPAPTAATPRVTLPPPPPLDAPKPVAAQPTLQPAPPPAEPIPVEAPKPAAPVIPEPPKSTLDSIPTLIVNEKGETEHLTLKHVLDKYYPPDPKKKHKNYALIGVLSFLVFGAIVLTSSIALAENGYWQGFSAVYRQTKLPIIWKGTNGSFEAMALKSYNLLNQKKAYKVDISSNVTAESMGNEANLTMSDIKSRQEIWRLATNKITGIKKSISGLMVKKYAAIEPGFEEETLDYPGISDDSSMSLDSYLPITVSAYTQEKADGNDNYEGTFEINFTDLVEKVPMVSDFIGGNSGKINLSAILIDKESKAYFKHNLNSFKSEEQVKLGDNAWFAIENVNEYIDEVKKENAAYTEITPENYKESDVYKNNEPLIKALIGKIQDKGIERVDGKALAHFQGRNISMDDVMKEISGNSDQSSTAMDSFRTLINLDLWVNPKTAELSTFNMEVILTMPEMNVRLISATKVKNYSVEKVNKIVAPSGSTVIPFDINKGIFGN